MKQITLKRTIALALALLVTLSLCPVTALAEEIFAEQEMTSHYVAEDDLGLTNDELFEAYAQREFDEALGFETPSFWRTSALEEGTLEKEIYDKVKAALAKVADGTTTSAEIKINPTKSWSLADLGVTSFSNAEEAIFEKLHFVYTCLLADCPLELYWHDKASGCITGYQPSSVGNKLSFSYVTYKFYVATDYSATGNAKTLVTKQTKTKATSTAVANAKAIVTANASKGDLAKLTAYKDKICELVSYDYTAANSMSTAGGISPWQMISVFDGDSNTNVVCEGYAKAFQYLCDLSTFSGDIECHTVSGMMYGGTGAGGHMWNVVTMDDGKNYLVDVTNCDAGTIGYPNKLFLAHTTNSEEANQLHTFNIGGQDILFIYDYSMKDLFCDGYLALSTSALASGNGSETPVITTQPVSKTATVGTSVTFSVKASGSNLSYQWQYKKPGSSTWTNSTASSGKTANYTTSASNSYNGYQYRCKVSDGTNSVTSNVVTLTVK